MKAEQLWASILQEAIQGKLVPQLESEPESNQIGEIPEEVPFAIPEKWKWRAFSEAVKSIATKPYQIKSSEVLSEGFIPVVSQSQRSIDGYCNDEDKVIPTELLPIVIFGDHTKVAKYVAFPFIVGADGTKLLRPIHNDLTCEFLYFFVQFMSQKIRNRGYSRHFQFLKSTFIPIPPLKEQVRITARLKKLKPLIEKYGQEQIAIEKLENSFPSLLRLSLLKEAIQGKLVPQLESEPEVSQIGKIPEDVPFNIPSKWKWMSLGNVLTEISDGSHNPPPNSGEGIPVLSAKNVNNGIIDTQLVTRWTTEQQWAIEDKKIHIEPGDVLLTIVGTIGRTAVVSSSAPKFMLQRSVCVMKPENFLNSEFLSLMLTSPTSLKWMMARASGTAQKGIYLKILRELPLPIPPLPEQHRIVAKLSELFDKLNWTQRFQ